MNRRRVTLIPLAAAMLSGCSYFERAPVYPEAQEVSRIETPNGLIRPVSDPSFAIPAGKSGVLSKAQQMPPTWETTDSGGEQP